MQKPKGSGDSMIPEWMKEVDIEPCQCNVISAGSFIQKTLDGILAFLQVALSMVMVFNTIHNMVWI
jgi:hypothetical protein